MRRKNRGVSRKWAILKEALEFTSKLVKVVVKDAVLRMAMTSLIATCIQLIPAAQADVPVQRSRRPVTYQTTSGR